MWWVLTTDNYHNKSSFDLFDFDNQPRRKALTKEQKINRLESELKRYENKKNYIRCISINKQIEKLKATENTYHVWSLKWSKWWGANNNGYTDDKRYAGVYLESNILSNQSYYNTLHQSFAHFQTLPKKLKKMVKSTFLARFFFLLIVLRLKILKHLEKFLNIGRIV